MTLMKKKQTNRIFPPDQLLMFLLLSVLVFICCVLSRRNCGLTKHMLTGGQKYTPQSMEGGHNLNMHVLHSPMYNYVALTMTFWRCSSVRIKQSFLFAG